jgi:cell division protein FtsB
MKKLMQILFIALLAIMIVAAVVLVFPAYHKYQSLKLKQMETREELNRQKAETMLLRQRLNDLENKSNEIEKLAREKYNLSKPGETVYKFKQE